MLPIGYPIEVILDKYIHFTNFFSLSFKKKAKVLFLLKTLDSRSFGYK